MTTDKQQPISIAELSSILTRIAGKVRLHDLHPDHAVVRLCQQMALDTIRRNGTIELHAADGWLVIGRGMIMVRRRGM